MDKKDLIKKMVKVLCADEYYQSIINVWNEEFNIDIKNFINIDKESDNYKASLSLRVSNYIDKLYSQKELIEMMNQDNSPYWHRINNQEYLSIIKEETQRFSLEIRNKLEAAGIKKSWWRRIKNFFS